MWGYTTANVLATAMLASTALPPSLKMSSPACAAKEWGATTAPFLPNMGFKLSSKLSCQILSGDQVGSNGSFEIF
jgi:hypothetical protein